MCLVLLYGFFSDTLVEKKGKVANLARKTRLQISLTDNQIKELEELAKEKGFTKSAIVALAIEEYKKGQKSA